jgi:hypothetical protein
LASLKSDGELVAVAIEKIKSETRGVVVRPECGKDSNNMATESWEMQTKLDQILEHVSKSQYFYGRLTKYFTTIFIK